MGRIFVAVHPPEATLDAIAAIPRPEIDGVRWTRREQWHVTLAFLGDVDPDEMVAALGSVRHPAVHVELGPVVEMIRDDVVVLPVHGLETLAVAVQDGLRPMVPDLPKRRFRGHLTLARSKSGAPAEVVGHHVDVGFEATEFCLVSSELGRDGARHTVVATFELDSAPPGS